MKNVWNAYKRVPLLTKMLAGMLLGVLLGILLKERAASLAPFGTVFLTLMQMIALPLIICNLLEGLCSLGDPKLFGKIGGKVLLYYFATTIFAMLAAVLVGSVIRPGVGFALAGNYVLTVEETPSISAAILGMIPSNIFAALANGKFDQVVIFVAIFGVSTLFLRNEQRVRVGSMFSILSSALSKIMGAVMLYAPVGICSLMAKTFGTYGASISGPILKYVLSVYLSVICVILLYLIILSIFTRIRPLFFLKKAAPMIVSAASTCSSIATLPVSLACADNIGVPKGISSFTLPLGNQINKDGMGIFFAMSFMFTAQAAGVTFNPIVLGKMILLGLLLTTGGAGIPGGAMVFLAMILDAFALPVEIVGIIAGIHSINEMGLTTLNCLGDLVGTTVATFSGRGRENFKVNG